MAAESPRGEEGSAGCGKWVQSWPIYGWDRSSTQVEDLWYQQKKGPSGWNAAPKGSDFEDETEGESPSLTSGNGVQTTGEHGRS